MADSGVKLADETGPAEDYPLKSGLWKVDWMSQAPLPPDARQRGRDGVRSPGRGESPCYAALDLGTNNCRLLIAAPTPGGGFRIVEAYSRIVRLGEGLTASGSLQPAAMERAMGALKICAERIKRRKVAGLRTIATQACRAADNGEAFLAQVKAETGLTLEVITPKQEAQLSVAGCLNLFDRNGAEAALVIDVGGGSTEMSWIDLTDPGLDQQAQRFDAGRLPIRAWLSMPVGVVSLAERFPEPADPAATQAWFRAMVEDVRERIIAFPHADKMRDLFEQGRAHMVGTSGAITSLAGLHLGLRRYDRARVDGLWMTPEDCTAVTNRLLNLSPAGRANEPCIGPDRADLVLAGAAILMAVQELWPCPRARVADRGLREGILLSLMSSSPKKRRRRRRRRGGTPATPVTHAATS
jgi:exopolyphosphatase/guanosine-5'-triphosphate,3'-diphosphate pyrophosphatase